MSASAESFLLQIATAGTLGDLFETSTREITAILGGSRGMFWTFPCLMHTKETQSFQRYRMVSSLPRTLTYGQRMGDTWIEQFLGNLPVGKEPITSREGLYRPEAGEPEPLPFVAIPFWAHLDGGAAAVTTTDWFRGDTLRRDILLGMLYVECDGDGEAFHRQAMREDSLGLFRALRKQIRLHWDIYQRTHRLSEAEKAMGRYEILLSTSQSIAGGVLLNDFMVYLLDQVILATKAQRGFIVLTEDDRRIEIAAGRSKRGYDIPPEEAAISMSTLRECLDGRKPIYVVNAQEDQHYAVKSSIIDLELQTILCTPLQAKDLLIGAIYLDSTFVSDSLAQEDLQLLEGLAGTAAMAISNNRLLLERIEREAVKRENEQLRKLDQRKTELLRTVAHELRNPLSIVVGYTELLKRKGTDNKELVDQALDRVLDHGKRIFTMLEGLLDISRLKSGLYRVAKKPLLLDECIDQVITGCQVLAQTKRMMLVRESPPNIMVFTDPDLLHQVLLNLFTNAIKFSPPGREVMCRVTPQPSEPSADRRIRVSVIDKGIGIPESELGRIFEVFHRIQSEDIPAADGIGLGLAITKTMVETLGSCLTVESQLGRGSTFAFDLGAL